MPTYKLTYFNSRGGAELSRFIFAQASVDYEDVRVEGEKWKELKPNTPFGVLPVLEVDGKELGASMVIARYLAEQHNLAGKNEFENGQIASIMDTTMDLNREVAKYIFAKDDDKEALKKKLIEETVPGKLKLFEKRAASNDHGWLHGDKLTWADFGVYISLDWLKTALGDDILKDYPGLIKLRASVEALPKIAEWIKNRPVSQY